MIQTFADLLTRYFTPKNDLAFLEQFKLTTKEFIAARAAEQSNKEQISSVSALDELRTKFSKQQVRASLIANRYKIQHQFIVGVHTYALERANIDAFMALNEETVSPGQVVRRAVDTIDRSMGACTEQMRHDFWHLINPFYWIYACFHVLLTSSGVSKPIGEAVTNLLSKILAAISIAATPWIKHMVEIWVQRLMQ